MRDPAVVADTKYYADNKDAWGPGRKTVMLAFYGGVELADNDIVELYHMKRKTVSARRCELWRLGYVIPAGMKKLGRVRVQVWRATPAGQKAIRILLNTTPTVDVIERDQFAELIT